METKFHSKNTFESSFDSFEFDDAFLMKIDSTFKKSKINEKIIQSSSKTVGKLDNVEVEKKKKVIDKRADYFDLPLFIEDLNESDFFDFNNKKKHSPKIVSSQENEKSNFFKTDNLMNCLSPIQDLKSKKQLNLSTSTPTRQNDISNSKEMNPEENLAKQSDCDYLEADLFDDWNIDEENKENTQRSTVTLSQAIRMIKEAEFARDLEPKECLNQSIDLLTGEVVGADIGNIFDESFDPPKSADKKIKVLESSNDSVVILETRKFSAAQKLNFQSEKADNFKVDTEKESRFKNVCFDSDDDFDFIIQDLLEKPKQVSELGFIKDAVTPLKSCDLDESTEGIVPFNKKRGKSYRIISESDVEEDSPNPKFRMKNNKKRSNPKENSVREFIESEAEVSDEVEVSSDEDEEEGDYDKSFVDEESYCTQNNSANMTTKYLESVKAINFPGRFKIPAVKPYSPDSIFSQISEESNVDYEIDSFCVNDVEEETKTELSELEIAEKILEMDRKKKRKQRSQKSRKFK